MKQAKKFIWFIKSNSQKIKKVLSAIVTLCSVVTAIASVVMAKQALDVSVIALKSTSQDTEPILDIDIDWWNDTIDVKNLSSDIYQIYHVNFGSITTIAICDSDGKISSVELEDRLTSMNLEHGHTEGTDCSDEDAKKYNKEFLLSLSDDSKSNWGIIVDNRDTIYSIEQNVRNACDSSEECDYWDVSPYFTYRFIEVYYADVYGNRNSQYYIYKYEYGSSWKIYKLNEDEYLEYISNTVSNFSEESAMEILFDKNRFIDMENTKYKNYYYCNEPRYMD